MSSGGAHVIAGGSEEDQVPPERLRRPVGLAALVVDGSRDAPQAGFGGGAPQALHPGKRPVPLPEVPPCPCRGGAGARVFRLRPGGLAESRRFLPTLGIERPRTPLERG